MHASAMGIKSSHDSIKFSYSNLNCSAIFGERLDIHSGGDDLKFPHHENELAQSEACFGCQQWTNYWVHTGLFGWSYSHRFIYVCIEVHSEHFHFCSPVLPFTLSLQVTSIRGHSARRCPNPWRTRSVLMLCWKLTLPPSFVSSACYRIIKHVSYWEFLGLEAAGC